MPIMEIRLNFHEAAIAERKAKELRADGFKVRRSGGLIWYHKPEEPTLTVELTPKQIAWLMTLVDGHVINTYPKQGAARWAMGMAVNRALKEAR